MSGETDRTVRESIDALFSWSTAPGRPGAAVVVLQDGEVIHEQGYGNANLEFGHPIWPESAFRIASVTKQFTSAVALLLSDEGKLDLDDEVQTWIPEMPRYAKPVTPRMLMQNTSGIRDSLECLRLSGGGIEIPHTHSETIGIVCRQQAPNFEPGSAYLYSNANFLLLTEIIQRITGRWLGDDIRERLLVPMAMYETRLGRSYGEVIPLMTTGYVAHREGMAWRFSRGVVAKGLSGEGGMVSTLGDMTLWLEGYRDDPLGVIERLATPATFSGGGTSEYGMGLVTEQWRGLKVIGHGGLWPGHRTEICYVPELDLGVVVMTNVDCIDPYVKAREILDIVGGDRFPEPEAPMFDPDLAETLVSFSPYVDAETGEEIGFSADDDGLWASEFDARFPVSLSGPDQLRSLRASGDLRQLTFLEGTPPTVEARYMNGRTRRFVTVQSQPPSTLALSGMVGRYVNDDLAPIEIIAGTDGLLARIDGRYVPRDPVPLVPVGDAALSMKTILGPWPGSNTLRLIRNGEGRVTGFALSGPRIKSVPYTKAE